MLNFSRARRHGLGRAGLALLLALTLVPGLSMAQAHEQREGGYTLRSSTVPSRSFDAATARNHGIEPAADRAVLNVTLMKDGAAGADNVRAQVRASVQELSGRRRAVEMRPIVANGRVSYLGAFDFLPRQVLRFEVVATPEPEGRPITLNFEETL